MRVFVLYFFCCSLQSGNIKEVSLDGDHHQLFYLRDGRCGQLLHLQMVERQIVSNQPRR